MIDPHNLGELNDTVCELAGVRALWCICGGWAIDLFLDEITRPHKDVDISIRRREQLLFQRHLTERGWQMEIAENGLHPWQAGDFLKLPANTIWCRRGEEFLELLFDEWDDCVFRFRKKQSITMPAGQATMVAASGFRILAPQIVLLYKSYDLKNTDYQSDFEHAYPRLSDPNRRWLTDALIDLHGSHPWLESRQNKGENHERRAHQEGRLGGR